MLVVEDSDTVRNLARQILEFHGYTVIDSPNGEDALVKFRQEGASVDLVITDVVMPKMSGPDLVQKLAALRPSVKVLYMSGYPADAVDSNRLVAAGFSFLPKPFTPEILAQKVRKVLDSGG